MSDSDLTFFILKRDIPKDSEKPEYVMKILYINHYAGSKYEAKSKNILDQLHVIPGQPHDRIPDWINAADVVILPSLSEGFPSIITETLACGRPVVANNVGGIPERITKEVGLLVQSGDLKAFAGAFIEALNHHWDPAKIQANATDLTWKSSSLKHLKIYENLVKDTARG